MPPEQTWLPPCLIHPGYGPDYDDDDVVVVVNNNNYYYYYNDVVVVVKY